MTTHSTRALAVVAALLLPVAWAGEATGLAPGWIVALGAAVALAGQGPVAARGIATLAGATLAGALVWLAAPLPQDIALLRVLPLLALLVGGLALARWGPTSAPAWPMLVGGAATLSGTAPSAALPATAGAVSGLAAGMLPFLLLEVVAAGRARPGPADERPASGDARGPTEAPADDHVDPDHVDSDRDARSDLDDRPGTSSETPEDRRA